MTSSGESGQGPEAEASEGPARTGPSWDRFFRQFLKDLKLWLFCAALLALFRLVFILWLRSKIDPASTFGDVLAAALNGLRYDSVIASCCALPSLLASAACGLVAIEKVADRVRTSLGVAFTVASLVLLPVSIGFFAEYDDVFNHWIFGLYYDDAGAVARTVVSQYGWGLPGLAVLVAALAAAGVFVLRRWLRKEFAFEGFFAGCVTTPPRRIAVSVLIVALFVGGVRGSFGRRPMQRKDAAVTRDEFLNKAVLNPYVALRYAIKDHMRVMGSAGLKAYLPDGDIARAARELFSTGETLDDLDAYTLKLAKGPVNGPARHVFVIVMESYDAWPLLDEYASLRLTEGLKELAARGLHIRSYLPASGGTMSSLVALITGLPNAGVRVNYQKSARRSYPTSPAATFGRLGYRTRLFYGGYLSWHRIGEFCRAQGFDEVYGGGHMGGWASGNEWGVDDEYLFDFVLGKLDDARPSFNMVLSTTYHPPYDVDVYAKGYPVREVPEEIERIADRPVDLKLFGHLWYADKCLGEFVRRAEAKLGRPVFAVTGDHSGRRHVKTRPSFFERSAVPLVLYGRDVLGGRRLPERVAGSHIDIGPTLVELAAPRGFPYHAVGNNLLAPRQRPIGIAHGKMVTPDFILDLSGGPVLHPLPWRDPPEPPPDLGELKGLHDAAHAVAWWRVMRGARLNREKAPAEEKPDDRTER